MTAAPQEDREMTQGDVSLTRAGAQARACAMDLAAVPELPPVPSLPSRALARVQAGHAALLEKPGTLIHAQPMTFHQAHARHRESAQHFNSRFMRGQRMGYGWFHLVAIKPALNYLEWATESELRFVIHVVLAAAVFAAFLLGGYLTL